MRILSQVYPVLLTAVSKELPQAHLLALRLWT